MAGAELRIDSDARQRASLHGVVDVDSAGGLREPGRRWLASVATAAPQQTCRLDLGAVQRCDSAALALLLDWFRQAAALNCSLEVHRLPEALAAMLPVLGLDAVLDAAPDGSLRLEPRVDPANSGTIAGLA